MKKNPHVTAEIRPFREPGNVGGWKNRFCSVSSPEKSSARVLNRSGTADKHVLESSNDAIIRLLKDSLAAPQYESVDSVAAKSLSPDDVALTHIQPFEHSLAITYISLCQSDNRMMYVSPQVANLGFSPEAWTGKPDMRLRQEHEEDIGRFEQALRHSRTTGGAFSCHYRLYDSCGRVRWFHDEASVVCDEFGAPLFVRGVMLDVTGKKTMEAELDELRNCLDRNVERRTEQLMKRMALLESCNATLCDRLASAQSELAVLNQQSVCDLPGAEQPDFTGQSHVLSDWTRNLIGTSVQDDWVGHAAA